MTKASLFCSLCQRNTDHHLLHQREGSTDGRSEAKSQVLACGTCRSESFRVLRRPLLEETACSG